MTFIQPWMLLALPLVALPVIIHLINQRRYQTVRWAAMMFLLAANRMSRICATTAMADIAVSDGGGRSTRVRRQSATCQRLVWAGIGRPAGYDHRPAGSVTQHAGPGTGIVCFQA